MGLSASQARLLSLTARMHDIEYKAQKLEAQKLQMANESRHVYQEYEDALNATKFQYKAFGADGSAVFLDGTYKTMCTYNPASMNQYTLVDGFSGKILTSKTISDAYAAASNADEFATAMCGVEAVPSTPSTPSSPSSPSTPVGPSGPSTPITPTASPVAPKTYVTVPDSEDTIHLYRKQEGKSFKVTQGSPKTVILHNTFDSKDYKYTVNSTNGTQTVSMIFLDNGRLKIQGDYLDINADNNQKDDIILYGDNNIINTGNLDDIVRIGGDIVGPSNVESNNNTINTGAGQDYVYVYGSDNHIDMGISDYDSATIGNNSYVSSTTLDATEIKAVAGQYTSTTTDNKIGSSYQGHIGDCRFLALINSLGNTSNYFTITKSGSNYNVEFKNYSDGSGNPKKVTVTPADIAALDGVTGDMDSVVLECAMNKLILAESGNAYDLQNASYQTYAKYIFGESAPVSMYMSSALVSGTSGVVNYNGGDINYDSNTLIMANDSNNLLRHLLADYESGNISNLTCGFASGDDDQLQIIGGHAYSIKEVTTDYVALVNPWDNQDIIKLDWETFLNHLVSVNVFGGVRPSCTPNVPENHCVSEVGNGGPYSVSSSDLVVTEEVVSSGLVNNISLVSSTGVETPAVVTNIFAAGSPIDMDEYNYYVNLYNMIEGAGGCIIVSNELLHDKQYIPNMINNGLAYLKMFNYKTSEWDDTNVATNTGLQEVANEVNLRKAEAKYESDMRRIDAKDKKYDIDIAALEQERNAIKTEMETLKTVAKDNVERTFKLFS